MSDNRARAGLLDLLGVLQPLLLSRLPLSDIVRLSLTCSTLRISIVDSAQAVLEVGHSHTPSSQCW